MPNEIPAIIGKPCEKKKCYNSLLGATKAAYGMNKMGKKKKFEAYLCKCDYYHIGHPKGFMYDRWLRGGEISG